MPIPAVLFLFLRPFLPLCARFVVLFSFVLSQDGFRLSMLCCFPCLPHLCGVTEQMQPLMFMSDTCMCNTCMLVTMSGPLTSFYIHDAPSCKSSWASCALLHHHPDRRSRSSSSCAATMAPKTARSAAKSAARPQLVPTKRELFEKAASTAVRIMEEQREASSSVESDAARACIHANTLNQGMHKCSNGT